MQPIDRTLAELAAGHDDVLTAEDLRAAGLSTSAEYRRRRSGLLVPIGPRTSRFAGHSPTWRSLLVAGLADLGDDAVVGGLATAALARLDGFAEGPVEFVVPRAQRRRTCAGEVRSVRTLPRIDTCRLEGLRSLSVTRALIELAGRLDDARLATALASAVRLGLTSIGFLRRRLDDLWYPGRPGSGRLRRLFADGPIESWLERRFLRLVREAGLPEPMVQQRFHDRDGGVIRVDFAFEPTPVVVEVGGQLGYLDPGERRRKEQRRNELQLLGKVVYFFATEEVREHPQDVLRTLSSALERSHTP